MSFSPPDKIDLITQEADGSFALIIVHEGEWEGSGEEEEALLQKINDYLYFIMGGEFYQHYPQAEGRGLRVQIDTGSAAPDNIKVLASQADEKLMERNIRVLLNVIG